MFNDDYEPADCDCVNDGAEPLSDRDAWEEEQVAQDREGEADEQWTLDDVWTAADADPEPEGYPQDQYTDWYEPDDFVWGD